MTKSDQTKTTSDRAPAPTGTPNRPPRNFGAPARATEAGSAKTGSERGRQMLPDSRPDPLRMSVRRALKDALEKR